MNNSILYSVIVVSAIIFFSGCKANKENIALSKPEALPVIEISENYNTTYSECPVSGVYEVHVYFNLFETGFINLKSQYKSNSIADKLKNLPVVALVLANNTVFDQHGKIDIIDGQFDKNIGSIVRASFINAHGFVRIGTTPKVCFVRCPPRF